MGRGRNTTVIGVRVPDSVYAKVRARAEKQGVTVSEYLRVAIEREIERSHHKVKSGGRSEPVDSPFSSREKMQQK